MYVCVVYSLPSDPNNVDVVVVDVSLVLVSYICGSSSCSNGNVANFSCNLSTFRSVVVLMVDSGRIENYKQTKNINIKRFCGYLLSLSIFI